VEDRYGPGGVQVEEVRSSSPAVLAALRRLVPQLSSSAKALEEDDLEALVRAESSRLLVATARSGDAAGEIVGTLTLVVYGIPTGRRAVIEDVVTDQAMRGRGIASALVTEALRIAEAEGARHVDLTSRPEREAANRLYVSLGFRQRETNVYRYEGPPPAS
jgi:ribosomal protein S18 acetylase RimI-like enzyme